MRTRIKSDFLESSRGTIQEVNATCASGDAWVDADFVGKRYGLKKPLVYKMVKDGRLPAYKIGRLVRFDMREVEKSMARLSHKTR